MLPKLGANKTGRFNSSQESSASLLPNAFGAFQRNYADSPSEASSWQLPATLAFDRTNKGSLKAFKPGDVPALPLLSPGSNHFTSTLDSRSSDQRRQPTQLQTLPHLPDNSSESTPSRPVPHYAIPQDRTPLWSERDRPGRFTTPKNPYKQNLDIAPKLKATAARLSSPARFGRSSELLPTSSTLHSPRSSPGKQRAHPDMVHQNLAPISPRDLAPRGSLKQGELLAAVNDSLEALGLPRGTPQAPLSRGQRWLATHGLSSGLSSTTIKPSHSHAADIPPPTALQDAAASEPFMLTSKVTADTLSAWDPESLEPAGAMDSFDPIEQSSSSAMAGLDVSMAETVKPRSAHNIRPSEQELHNDSDAGSGATASANPARSDAVPSDESAAELQPTQEQTVSEPLPLHLQSNTAEMQTPVKADALDASESTLPDPSALNSTQVPRIQDVTVAVADRRVPDSGSRGAEATSPEQKALSPSSCVRSTQDAESLLALADPTAFETAPHSSKTVTVDGVQQCDSRHEPAAEDNGSISAAADGASDVQPFSIPAGVMLPAPAVPQDTSSVHQSPASPQAVEDGQLEGSNEQLALTSSSVLAAEHFDEGHASLQADTHPPEQQLDPGSHATVSASSSQAEAVPASIQSTLSQSAASTDKDATLVAAADTDSSTQRSDISSTAAGVSITGPACADGAMQPDSPGAEAEVIGNAPATNMPAIAATAEPMQRTGALVVVPHVEVVEAASPDVTLFTPGQKDVPEGTEQKLQSTAVQEAALSAAVPGRQAIHESLCRSPSSSISSTAAEQAATNAHLALRPDPVELHSLQLGQLTDAATGLQSLAECSDDVQQQGYSQGQQLSNAEASGMLHAPPAADAHTAQTVGSPGVVAMHHGSAEDDSSLHGMGLHIQNAAADTNSSAVVADLAQSVTSQSAEQLSQQQSHVQQPVSLRDVSLCKPSQFALDDSQQLVQPTSSIQTVVSALSFADSSSLVSEPAAAIEEEAAAQQDANSLVSEPAAAVGEEAAAQHDVSSLVNEPAAVPEEEGANEAVLEPFLSGNSGLWRDCNSPVSSAGSDHASTAQVDIASDDYEDIVISHSSHSGSSLPAASSSSADEAWVSMHAAAAGPAEVLILDPVEQSHDSQISIVHVTLDEGPPASALPQGSTATALMTTALDQSQMPQGSSNASALPEGSLQPALMQQGMAAATAQLLRMGTMWGSSLGSLCNLGLLLSPCGFILLTPKYDIIGEGAYGLVMKCRVVDTESIVAIKEFKIEDIDEDAEELRACSIREVEVLRELHHPNVVTYLEDFMLGNKLFIVCEYMPYSLLQLLEGDGQPPLDPSEAIAPEAGQPSQEGSSGNSSKGLPRRQVHAIMLQLLAALDYIHARGIVYRDVKPENLLMDNNGTLKLCDFGFSRHVTEGDILTDYVATRWYRAPELLLGAPYAQPDGQTAHPQYGCAIDIWAAGCLMAELLTGEPLFPGSSDIDQLHLQLQLLGPLPATMTNSFLANPHNAQAVPLPAKPTSSLKAWLRGGLKHSELQLLAGMLQLDPHKRWSAQRCRQYCLQHFNSKAG